MNVDNLFEQAAFNWRDNHGVGTALVPAPLNDKVLIYQILSRMYAKNKTLSTIIIVDYINLRSDILEFLTHQDNEENDAEFKRLIDNKFIRVFTKGFVINNFYKFNPNLCILYNPEVYNFDIANYFGKCQYRLAIINRLLDSKKNSANLYKDAPLLECFKQVEIDELRVSSPVEEYWIGVDIPEDSESWKLYQYYTKYIETSINIFGSFDMIKQARVGNETLNISSMTICSQIAQENGWNEHLDMSFEFNQKIDELYNPNNLRERATNTYEIIRNRANLVTDYPSKRKKVFEIVSKNPNDKILIISKRGEFANKITDYINDNSEEDICGNYHNKVDDIPAVDVYGNPVYIKSGVEKGKRKSMGYKAQMTLNEKKFNLGKLSCLSLSNSPEKSLNVSFDTIIITSPLCEDIRSYLYRLTNIKLNGSKIKLYSIFCKNTLEQQRLLNKPITETHLIVNKDEIIDDIENNFDFVIAD